MKLKEYMALNEPGAEITCWDKDVDSEFYFYTKERGEKSLYGKDFPNVDKCMDQLAEVLDVVKIHDNSIEVNLYEKLEHPNVIQFAKENLYTERQYEDDADVVMLLFDDNVLNISAGYEQFSQMMVECLEQVYGPEKTVENNKIRVYGFSVVNSEGYYDGRESETHIYNSTAACVKSAYESYLNIWKECESDGLIENHYNNDAKCLSIEEFANDFLSNKYVLIQLPDSHVQFEYFVKELELPKEVALENRKPTLADRITAAEIKSSAQSPEKPTPDKELSL